MDPILSSGKESLKRLCLAGEEGQGYSVFTSTLGLGPSDLGDDPTRLVLPALREAVVLVTQGISDDVFWALVFQLGF